MIDKPERIKALIGRCVANEQRFDNDEMSTALVYADHVERQRDEALDALRELHDFSDKITYGKYVLRSQLAAEKAAEILERYGK